MNEVKPVEITVERSSTPEQTASDNEDTNTRDVDYIVDGRPTADNNDIMTASMIQRRIITEEEAKAALAERRRLVRVEAERQAELERQRIEAEEAAELKRQQEEEERQRQLEEETLRLVEQQRKTEEERLQQAIEVCMNEGRRWCWAEHTKNPIKSIWFYNLLNILQEAKQREEEERVRREEEERQKVEREEQERKAREEAEKLKQEVAERLKKEEKEREERRKRVEAIMSRTRAKGGAATPSNTPIKVCIRSSGQENS